VGALVLEQRGCGWMRLPKNTVTGQSMPGIKALCVSRLETIHSGHKVRVRLS